MIPRIAGYPSSWKCNLCEVKEECKSLKINASEKDIRIIRNVDLDSMVNVVG